MTTGRLPNRPAKRRRVLVLAQTPPPVHGQAVAVRQLLEGQYSRIELSHVRMAFSSRAEDVGRFAPGKVAHAGRLLAQVIARQAILRAEVLYYCPAGPDRVPFLRDVLLLPFLRPLFSKTVFHFHAPGLSEFQSHLSIAERFLFRRAYLRPEMAIRLAPQLPDDSSALQAKQERIIPNGIPDLAGDTPLERADPPRVLFLATLLPEKGADVLVEAAAILRSKGRRFQVDLVGEWGSRSTGENLQAKLRERGLSQTVELHGEVLGPAKLRKLREASIFCLPTFYHREGLPLAVIEGMQFALPVVSTSWRGIPFLVQDERSGLLVPPRDPQALADALDRLLLDPALGRRLGQEGRNRYLREFTLEKYRDRLESALAEV
jgi:glycosyltransferase involved in cell wall biosynthesis